MVQVCCVHLVDNLHDDAALLHMRCFCFKLEVYLIELLHFDELTDLENSVSVSMNFQPLSNVCESSESAQVL